MELEDTYALGAYALCVWVRLPRSLPLRHIQQLNWNSLLNYKNQYCVLFYLRVWCSTASIPAFQAGGEGSNPFTRSIDLDAYSNLNHQNCPKVKTPPYQGGHTGSNPVSGIILQRREFLEKNEREDYIYESN